MTDEELTPSPPHPVTPAHNAFREAEAMQQEMQPQYPLLYSLRGYRYCELLLAEVCLRISELNIECRTRNVEIRSEGADTDSATSSLDIPCSTFDIPSGLSELQSEIESLRNRAETTLGWVTEGKLGLLSIALNHLTLGRTWQLSARLESARSSGLSPSPPVASSDQEPSEPGPDREIPVVAESPDSQAEHHLTQSVSLLRQSGAQEFIAQGLLHSAALWREMLEAAFGWPRLLATGVAERQEVSESDAATSDGSVTEVDEPPVPPEELLARAERDLSEAETIAERGSMLIWQIEAALERSQLFLTLAHPNFASSRLCVNPDATDNSREGAKTQREWLDLAREKLDETRRLVKQAEKPYEPHVPDWDEWEPPEYTGVFEAGDIVGYHCRNDEIERLQTEIDALVAASEL